MGGCYPPEGCTADLRTWDCSPKSQPGITSDDFSAENGRRLATSFSGRVILWVHSHTRRTPPAAESLAFDRESGGLCRLPQ